MGTLFSVCLQRHLDQIVQNVESGKSDLTNSDNLDYARIAHEFYAGCAGGNTVFSKKITILILFFNPC